MADYADLTTVKTMLGITGTDQDARLALLNAIASRELEQVCRATWGAAATDIAVTIRPETASTRLVLPTPVRTITGITIDGDAFTDYRLLWETVAGDFRGLETLYGSTWGDEVIVTGQWADMPTGSVPPGVVEAANVLVVGYYRRDHASDGEVSGPDGLTFRPGNPWTDDRVKRCVAAYTAAAAVVL